MECEEAIVTSTQYPVMSGSTPVISSVKGGVQLREIVPVEALLYIPNDPTAERRPTWHQKHALSHRLKEGASFYARHKNGYYVPIGV